MNKSPYTLPSTTKRDVLIGLAIGAVVFGFVIFAIMKMGSSVVGNTLTGTIVRKEFTPLSEQRVTIGKGGINAQNLDGEYLFKVRVKNDTYSVWVEKKTYESKKEGDSFLFPRPAE